MADRSEIERVLAEYYAPAPARTLRGDPVLPPAAPVGAMEVLNQYLPPEPPALANFAADPQNELGTQATTAEVGQTLDRLYSGFPGTMRGWADSVRTASQPDNIIAGGLDSMANWISGTPRIGADTIWPMGAGVVGSMGLGLFGRQLPGETMIGIFGGRNARTADLPALQRAETMAADGRPRDEIWRDTGWFQGADGRWRFEIDDSGSFIPQPTLDRLASEGVTSGMAMRSGLNHPALFEAYPDLMSLHYRYVNDPNAIGGGGEFRTGAGLGGREALGLVDARGAQPETVRSVVLHELQHAVQEREGFAPGASPALFNQQQEAQLARDALSFRREFERMRAQRPQADRHAIENAIIDEYRQMDAMDWLPSREARDIAMDLHGNPTRQLEDLINLYSLDQRVTPPTPMDMYRRTAGEVEARNVMARRNFSPPAREVVPPWQSQDVRDVDQILRHYYGGPQMSVRDPAEFWRRAADLEDTLPPNLERALEEWVGGPPRARETGYEGGVYSTRRMSDAFGANPSPDALALRASLEEQVTPIRDLLREYYGPTITAYRGVGPNYTDDGRSLVSYSTNRQVAEGAAGVPRRERPVYSDEQIAAFEKELAERGEVTVGGTTYRMEDSIDPGQRYTMMYDRHGNEITDAWPDMATVLRRENDEALTFNRDREAALARVQERQIPVEDVVWATNRFGQQELIARPPSQAMVDEVLSRYSAGPERLPAERTKGGRGSRTGQGGWQTALDGAPVDELVQVRAKYPRTPNLPADWPMQTHVIGARRSQDGRWFDRQGNEVFPEDWRPFK